MNTTLTLLATGTLSFAVTGAVALIAAMLKDRTHLQSVRHQLEQPMATRATGHGLQTPESTTVTVGATAANDASRLAA